MPDQQPRPASARQKPLPQRRRPVSVVRLLRNLFVILVVSAGGIGTVLWWEDRPLRQIEHALAAGEHQQALVFASKFLESHPESSHAHELKARALVGLGRWSDATRLFENLGAESLESQRAWSQALLHLERWSAALPLLKRFHELNPTDPDVLHELTACYGKLEEFEAAVAGAEQLSKIQGNEHRGFLLLGILQQRQGNHILAAEALAEVVRLNPDASNLQVSPAEFFLAYGSSLLNDGRPDEARPQIERSLELGATPTARALLAETCEQLGEVPQAVELWKQAVAGDPALFLARDGLARAALEKNQPEEALHWLEPVASRDDLPSTTAYLIQRAYTILGDMPKVAEWEPRVASLREREQRQRSLDSMVRQAPQMFWSRAIRAHRFAMDGNLTQAMLLVSGLIDEQPREPFIRQLAEALRDGGQLPSLDLIPFEQY